MLLSLLLLGLLAYFVYHQLVGKRKGLPPGPLPLPLVGNLHQFDQVYPDRTFDGWKKTYGPVFTTWFGPEPMVVIADYELMKDLLAGKTADVFSGRPQNFLFEYFRYGRFGVVISDGDLWKEQRRFSLHVLRDFGFGRNIMEQKILVQVESLIDHLNDLLEGKARRLLSLDHPLQLCVANIISDLTFGFAFQKNDPKLVRILEIGDEMLALGGEAKTTLMSYAPWLRHIPFTKGFGCDKLKKLRDEFWSIVFKDIDAKKTVFDPVSQEPSDFVEAYLKEMHKRQVADADMGWFSDHQLAITTGDIWFAGLETTVTTLRWGILFMIHHPTVQDKVHEELIGLFQNDKTKNLSMSDRSKLPFCSATIQEVQRMANLLPINIPHAVTEDISINGYAIPRGTTVLPQIASALMDAKAFPNPEKFDPTRFLKEDGSAKKVEELIPFSIGKRACLGESLARMELFLIFTTLMRHFKFSAIPGEEPPSTKPLMGFVRHPQPYEVLMERI